ncbi:MAG: hypothetical protein GXY83_38425 [Rhodopirellula sp.]|nr:hypothetical protein [Rhodopirellula sp.]
MAEETAEAAAPTVDPAEPAAAEPPAAGEATDSALLSMSFNFRFQPWEDVLDWFAERAGYSLLMDTPPPGTFNYSDDRTYTPAEAIDLLNSVLLMKGYTLVLRDRMLMLVNLDDGVPPNFVSTVPAEELDQRGEYELVSSLFQLENLTAEEAEQEIEELLGPQGSVVVLKKARQLLVTETAGKLRTIGKVIERADNPSGTAGEEVAWFELHFASPEEVLLIVRQLFNIPADQNAATDGSIRFALDPVGLRLLVSGNSQKLDQVRKVLETIDAPGSGAGVDTSPRAALQLEIYDVTPADPEAALKVIQTLMAGLPGVRLSTDPKTGNLIALARPEEHATIRATLDQMQRDAQRMEVFRLRVLDPQVAILAIGKLFSSEGPKAPSVDADPSTRQLLVRGKQGQIEQIRSLLEKMGEPGGAAGAASVGGGNVRMIPLSGAGGERAVERLRGIWPMLHDNPMRIVTPSAVIPTLRGTGPAASEGSSSGAIEERLIHRQPASQPDGDPAAPGNLREPPSIKPPVPGQPSPDDRSTRSSDRAGASTARILLASEPALDAETATVAEPSPAAPANSGTGSPIVVAPGPGGIMIASEDAQALDDFEQLLGALAGNAPTGPKATVFYLKHAKAQTVSDTLTRILASSAGRSPTPAPPGPGGQPAAASGAAPTGVMGYMLGTSAGTGLTAPVQITADPRLNALVVLADPADVALIEQILMVLDQRESPEEILAQAKPQLIPVYNTQAADVAEIVKQVYQDRMVTGGGGNSGGGRPSNPMEFFQMMRGQGGDREGRGASRGGTTEQVDRLSIGVDERTNSVIVCAADLLFQEVKQLVEALDNAAVESDEAVEVVSLRGASPQAVQQALATLMGDSVQTSGSSRGASSGTSGSRSSSGRSGSSRSGSSRTDSSRSGSDMESMQRRMEFFRSLRGGESGRGGFGSRGSGR